MSGPTTYEEPLSRICLGDLTISPLSWEISWAQIQYLASNFSLMLSLLFQKCLQFTMSSPKVQVEQDFKQLKYKVGADEILWQRESVTYFWSSFSAFGFSRHWKYWWVLGTVSYLVPAGNHTLWIIQMLRWCGKFLPALVLLPAKNLTIYYV